MKVLFNKQSEKDWNKIKQVKALKNKAVILLAILEKNPYQNPPSYEKLSGELQNYYSRRINKQHRLVYSVDEKEQVVRVIGMWTHYEN